MHRPYGRIIVKHKVVAPLNFDDLQHTDGSFVSPHNNPPFFSILESAALHGYHFQYSKVGQHNQQERSKISHDGKTEENS